MRARPSCGPKGLNRTPALCWASKVSAAWRAADSSIMGSCFLQNHSAPTAPVKCRRREHLIRSPRPRGLAARVEFRAQALSQPGRKLDRKISRLRTSQDSCDIAGRTAKALRVVDAIAYQTPCIDVVTEAVNRRQPRGSGERSDPLPLLEKQRVCKYDDHLHMRV